MRDGGEFTCDPYPLVIDTEQLRSIALVSGAAGLGVTSADPFPEAAPPPVESVSRAVARVRALFDLPPPEIAAEPVPLVEGGLLRAVRGAEQRLGRSEGQLHETKIAQSSGRVSAVHW